jgi:hypothetical protein
MSKYKVAAGRSLFVPSDEGGRVVNEGEVVTIEDSEKAQEYLDRGTLVSEDTEVETEDRSEFEKAQQETADRQVSEHLPGQAPEDQQNVEQQSSATPTEEQLAQDFQDTTAQTTTSGPVNQ